MRLKLGLRVIGPGAAHITIEGVEIPADELEIAIQRGSDEFYVHTHAVWLSEQCWHRLPRYAGNGAGSFLAVPAIVDALAEVVHADTFRAQIRWPGGADQGILRIYGELIASVARQAVSPPSTPPMELPTIEPTQETAGTDSEAPATRPDTPSPPNSTPNRRTFQPWLFGLAALLPILLLLAWFFGRSPGSLATSDTENPPSAGPGPATTDRPPMNQRNQPGAESQGEDGQGPASVEAQPAAEPAPNLGLEPEPTEEAPPELGLVPEPKPAQPPDSPVPPVEPHPLVDKPAATPDGNLELEPEPTEEAPPELGLVPEPKPAQPPDSPVPPVEPHPLVDEPAATPDRSGSDYVAQLVAKTQDPTVYKEHARRRAEQDDCDASLLLYDLAANASGRIAGEVARMYDPQGFTASPCIDHPNRDNAETYYMLAAKEGIPHAQRRYGQLLIEGQTSGPAYKEGRDWLRKAAHAGDQEPLRVLELPRYRSFENPQ